MSAAKLKVKTSSKPNSRIAVEVEVPADRCKNSYDEALSKLSRSISIPGFRKGKVPKTVVIANTEKEEEIYNTDEEREEYLRNLPFGD